MSRSTRSFGLVLVCFMAFGRLFGMGDPPADEKKAVERAVLDYCESVYDMKPELIERSVHPRLHKFGFYRPASDKPYVEAPCTYEDLIQLAKVWNKDGRFGSNPRKEVQVFEVLDRTAAAKVVGEWGIDYIHLAKYDGQWKIMQVLWQSHPNASRP